MELVQDNKSLIKISKMLKKNEVLFIDTEFLRNSTYWPKLCLIQIKAKKKVYLIDPLAKDIDLNIIKEIFIDQSILKVFPSLIAVIKILKTYQRLQRSATISRLKCALSITTIKLCKK